MGSEMCIRDRYASLTSSSIRIESDRTDGLASINVNSSDVEAKIH